MVALAQVHMPAELPPVRLTDIINLTRSPSHYLDGLVQSRCRYRDIIESALVDVLTDVGMSGLFGLSDQDARRVRKMATSIRTHDKAVDLISRSLRGKQWTWNDQETGLLCEATADFVIMSENPAAVRVITCVDASESGIRRTLVDDGAMIEAALISDCLYHTTGRRISVFYVAVETVSPHAVAVYEIDGPTIKRGQALYKGALELLAWCRDENRWPGYQPDGKPAQISLL